ncbi:hypothetical protein MTO96_040179, partial [Rhipicephalus appendiculatus]
RRNVRRPPTYYRSSCSPLPLTAPTGSQRYPFEGQSEDTIRCDCAKYVFSSFPAQTTRSAFLAAGVAYRESLRQVFDTALKHVVELNISSFHFGRDLDLSDLLRDGSLQFLQSLSTSTCGLRRPLAALYRLARCCPDFKELDVRFDEGGGVVRCDGCEGHVPLDPEEAKEVPNCSRAVFPKGLAKLTLKSVRLTVFSCLIDRCLSVTTLRLLNCPTPSSLGYARLMPVIAHCTKPRRLVIEYRSLQFQKDFLLDKLCRVSSLEYLYLLSTGPLSEEDVALPVSDKDIVACVHALSSSLPHRSFLHIHYRSVGAGCRSWRMTWMRRAADIPENSDALFENGPCFQCCSTATIIGLGKPLNRYRAVSVGQGHGARNAMVKV